MDVLIPVLTFDGSGHHNPRFLELFYDRLLENETVPVGESQLLFLGTCVRNLWG